MGEMAFVGFARGKFGKEAVLAGGEDLINMFKKLFSLFVGLVRGENYRVICDTEGRMHLVVKLLLQLNLVTAQVIDDARIFLGFLSVLLRA